MPLNVRRFYTSVLLVLFGFSISQAQTVAPQPSPVPQVQPTTNTGPTSGDVMRERIFKAKVYIAVRNYNAAIYELENIRKESADAAVQSVTSVLLMNSYLELGDYRRAQDFLNQFYLQQKNKKANALANYLAVAGQVVKGARSRVERYRALGLNVADRTLPSEALNDLEKMREMLELVINQSKEISQTSEKSADAIALIEEATISRSMLARDAYDARAWKEKVADFREQVAVNGRVVFDAVNEDKLPADNIAPPQIEQTIDSTIARVAKEPTQLEEKDSERPLVKDDTPIFVPSAPANEAMQTVAKIPKTAELNVEKKTLPIDAGHLLPFATKQSMPIYPAVAKLMRTVGIVRVDVVISETGDVAEVKNASGPSLLQSAAKDAILKWKFKPFVRDGQPVKATGYVNFNFTL